RNAHACAGPADNLFRAAELEGGKKVPVRNNFQILPSSGYANHLLDVGIVRGQFFIAERPVLLDALKTSFAEVPSRESEAGSIPVNSATASRPNSIHKNIVAVLIANSFGDFFRVSRRRQLPFLQPAMGKLIGPGMRMKIVGRHHSAGFH